MAGNYAFSPLESNSGRSTLPSSEIQSLEGIYSAYLRAYDVILPQTSCYQELVRETVSALQGKKKILDAGIGTGLVALALDSADRQIYGVDITETMLRYSAEKIQKANAKSRIFLSQQNIFSLNFPDQFFDGLACLNTLYHSYDYRTPLQEAARVAQNDAVFVVSGPNTRFNSELFLEKVISEFAQKENPQQYCPHLGLVIEATLQLSRKKMKHFLDSWKMAEVLRELGFKEVLTARDDFYYGNSYFVVARK